MKTRKGKRQTVKPRATTVEQMWLHCKPGDHGDARKEVSRKACRKFKRLRRETAC